MTESVEAPRRGESVPTLGELFVTFATIALSGFGGVLVWARRMVVEERRWLTPAEFNEAYSLAQFLPGPNIVNFSVVFGRRLRGVPGAAVALIGLLGPPVVLVTVIGMLYARYGEIEPLRHALRGASAAAAGLMIATAAKMARPLLRDRRFVAPLVALVTFAAVGVMQWSLPLVLLVMAPASVALAWWTRP
jgi:chromate transporter